MTNFLGGEMWHPETHHFASRSLSSRIPKLVIWHPKTLHLAPQNSSSGIPKTVIWYPKVRQLEFNNPSAATQIPFSPIPKHIIWNTSGHKKHTHYIVYRGYDFGNHVISAWIQNAWFLYQMTSFGVPDDGLWDAR